VTEKFCLTAFYATGTVESWFADLSLRDLIALAKAHGGVALRYSDHVGCEIEIRTDKELDNQGMPKN